MSFCSFGPVDSLDFSILLSWGCSFYFFSSVLLREGKGGFRILRIKVIVWGYLQPAACIKWRLEECTLKVQGKCRGPGIWELHSCEPKGKGWGFMANFFWCHVILKPTSESITSSFQSKAGLGEFEREQEHLHPLKSSTEVNLNFWAWWTYVFLKNSSTTALERWWNFDRTDQVAWKPTLEVKTPAVMNFWRIFRKEIKV